MRWRMRELGWRIGGREDLEGSSMKWIVAGVLGVALTMIGQPALGADDGVPTVELAGVSGSTVTLTGTVAHTGDTVRIQRRNGYFWANVTSVRAVGRTFTATFTQAARVETYIAMVGMKRSAGSVQVDLDQAQSAPAPTPTPTPEVTPAPAPAPDPTAEPAPVGTTDCGAPVLKADGTPWVCTFDDEFDGTSLDRTKWLPQTSFVTGTPAAHACYRDDPSNVSVSGGSLNLTVRKESAPIACVNQSMGATAGYSAGMVSTYHLFSQQYGRVEARMRVAPSAVPGLQETFWLWPDDRDKTSLLWPAAGEVDVAETYSQYPRLNVPFLHYTYNDNGGPIPGTNTSWTCAAERGVFNDYTLEWTPTRLAIAVNGTTCLVNTSGDVAFQRRYILAFTQALGTGANALTSQTPLPATMNVDYVRVWS